MTDTDPLPTPPPALAPLDEAYVAYADAMSRLINDALADFPLPYVHDHGRFLQTTLHLRYLADVLVQKAVIVETERGASWSDLGEAAAHIGEQAANEKWAHVVRGWTLVNHRRHCSATGSADLARELDAWYSRLVPGTEFAISSGLAATDPRNIVGQQAAEANRAAARMLRKRLDDLQAEDADAYGQTVGGADPEERAAGRRRWAAARTAMAEAYDQLGIAEPTIADDHRAAAAQQRALAADIAGSLTAEAETDGGSSAPEDAQ